MSRPVQQNPKEIIIDRGDTQIPISDDEYCEISSKSVWFECYKSKILNFFWLEVFQRKF